MRVDAAEPEMMGILSKVAAMQATQRIRWPLASA
jgi:hypothetical protein